MQAEAPDELQRGEGEVQRLRAAPKVFPPPTSGFT